MDVYSLNSNFERVGVIDRFVSFLWAERYNSYGDFVMDLKLDLDLLQILQLGSYLEISESDYLMIIEDVHLRNSGNDFLMSFKGRGTESFLDRRIIWGQKTITGSIQDSIESILNESFISPTNEDRTFDNFTFLPSTDPYILSLEGDCQYAGDNVYRIINDLCLTTGIGFRVKFIPPNSFQFYLYNGSYRTHSQTENPYVIFSSEYDNLISSSYRASSMNLKTAAMVAGEGEWPHRNTIEVLSSGLTGIDRREIFVDVKDISSETEDGEMTTAEYQDQLIQRGLDALSEWNIKQDIEAEVDPTRKFIYGTDFFLGDVVEIVTEFGISRESRVTEVIRVIDGTGEKIYPKFELMEGN